MAQNVGTVRHRDFIDATEPCGDRRTHSMKSKGLRLAPTPPPIATRGMVQGSHIDARADEIFDLLKVVDVGELKKGLDTMLAKALQVLGYRIPVSRQPPCFDRPSHICGILQAAFPVRRPGGGERQNIHLD